MAWHTLKDLNSRLQELKISQVLAILKGFSKLQESICPHQHWRLCLLVDRRYDTLPPAHSLPDGAPGTQVRNKCSSFSVIIVKPNKIQVGIKWCFQRKHPPLSNIIARKQTSSSFLYVWSEGNFHITYILHIQSLVCNTYFMRNYGQIFQYSHRNINHNKYR